MKQYTFALVIVFGLLTASISLLSVFCRPRKLQESQRERPTFAGMDTFRRVAAIAFFLGITLVATTAVFSYLAFIDSKLPACLGHKWPIGLRASDLLSLPFVALLPVGPVGFMALGWGKSTRAFFDTHTTPAFEIASRQVTHGMISAYGIILAALSMNGGILVTSIEHYQTILATCRT